MDMQISVHNFPRFRLPCSARESQMGSGGVRIDLACEEFLRDCANVRKLSGHTTRAYQLDLARFTKFAGAKGDRHPERVHGFDSNELSVS